MSDIHTLVGAYSVDALTDVERVRFEEHLTDCEACRREVQEFHTTLGRLGPIHATAPPEGLRAAVLDQIGSVRVLPPLEAEPELPQAQLTHRRWLHRAVALVAAVSLLANVILGVTLIRGQLEHQHEQEMARLDSVAMAELMAAPDLRVHPARMDDGTEVSYYVSPTQGRALLVAAGLAEPAPGRTWQAWSIRNGLARSAGLVTTGGTVRVWLDWTPGAQTLALTDEALGGSDQPTTDPQAVASLG